MTLKNAVMSLQVAILILNVNVHHINSSVNCCTLLLSELDDLDLILMRPCVPISDQITQYSNFGKFVLRNPIDSDGHCANFSITAYTFIHKRKLEFHTLDTFSLRELFSSLEKLQPLISLFSDDECYLIKQAQFLN